MAYALGTFVAASRSAAALEAVLPFPSSAELQVPKMSRILQSLGQEQACSVTAFCGSQQVLHLGVSQRAVAVNVADNAVTGS